MISVTIKPSSGQLFSHAVTGAATATNPLVSARQQISAFRVPYQIAIDGAGVSITTGVGGGEIRIVIFNSDANGRPTTLLAQSDVIDASTTGTKIAALSATLEPSTQYWVGTWANASITIRGLANASKRATYSNGPSVLSMLTRTGVTYTGTSPGWTYTSADHVDASGEQFVLMRAA